MLESTERGILLSVSAVGAIFVIVILFVALPAFARAKTASSTTPTASVESAKTPEIERAGPIASPTLKTGAAPGSVRMSATLAPTATTAAAPVNLIPNPSLEDAEASGLPTSWAKGGYGANTRTHAYPVSPHTGEKAAQVTISSYTSGDAKWYFRDIAITGGQTYLFSDYSRADVPSEIDVQFTRADGTRSYKVLAVVSASSSYQLTSTEFTAPSDAVSLTVFHLINRVGTLTVDDYSLTQVDTSPPPPGGSTMVPNGDFETVGTGGNPASWARGGYGTNTRAFSYPTVGVDGSRAAQVSISSYASGDAKWYFTPIALAPGSYSYSDQYQSTVPNYVVVQLHNADSSYTYTTIGTFGASDSFSVAQGSFTVPSGTQDVTIFHLIKAVGTLTIDNAAIGINPSTGTSIFDTGAVTLRFDDGRIGNYTVALPKMESKGFKGTFYIITRELYDYGYSGFVSKAQIKDMAARGQEIAAHTQTHPDLATLSPEQQRAEVVGSRNDLLAMNVGPVHAFAYPFGSYNATTIGIVRDAGFLSGAATISGYVRPEEDHYQLRRQGIRVDTTVDQVKAWVDQAVDQKLWLIITFHGIDDSGETYTTTPETFSQIVDYIAATGVRVITASEGLADMNP